MTYEEAKEIADKLNKRVDELSKELNTYEKNEVGLVSHEVTRSVEYQAILTAFNSAFSELQNINYFLMKNFKKEYLSDRSKKREIISQKKD